MNSIRCITFVEVGIRGWLSMRAPSMHNMFGMSLAKHVHGVVGHVHWSIHGGIVLSCGLEF